LSAIIERIKERRKALIGLTIVFLLFTIPVIILVDDFVQNVILVPIAYYIWLGNILLNALPQSYFLTFLIVISAIIAIPSLRRVRQSVWRADKSQDLVEGDVALWEERLSLLASGAYTEQRFAYHLGRMVLQLIAFEERLPIRTVIAQIEKGGFNMPDDVRHYVLTGVDMGSLSTKLPLPQRIIHWLKRINPVKQKTLTTKQYENILPTIQYIESRLKITQATGSMSNTNKIINGGQE
jgi:hypothetical protein